MSIGFLSLFEVICKSLAKVKYVFGKLKKPSIGYGKAGLSLGSAEKWNDVMHLHMIHFGVPLEPLCHAYGTRAVYSIFQDRRLTIRKIELC